MKETNTQYSVLSIRNTMVVKTAVCVVIVG